MSSMSVCPFNLVVLRCNPLFLFFFFLFLNLHCSRDFLSVENERVSDMGLEPGGFFFFLLIKSNRVELGFAVHAV